MAELHLPGATLHYEIWGESGSWMTLVNGHNRPRNDFRMLGRYLVERGWRVLALDNRGSGQTGSEAEFTLLDMVTDVEALWQREGIRRTCLLGISMGGFIAQMLAARAAGEDQQVDIGRLVLVSTAIRASTIRRDERPWSNDAAAVEAKLIPYFTRAFAERNQPLIRGMAKQIAKAVEGGPFVVQSQRQLRAVQGFDLTPQAARIKVPTLVVHGADDQIIPVASAYELAAAITGAKLLELPASGHLLLAERPKELYEAVAAFIRPELPPA